jgi:predicted amidohydrolase YtcJ
MQPWLFYQPGRRDSEFRTLLASGAQMAFGSDASMTDLNPLLGIYAAVESGLTVDQAVRAYTVSAAYAEFQESVKGTIELGKLADIVMLSDNIFSIAPRKIRESKVILTIVGGRIVYQADEPR